MANDDIPLPRQDPRTAQTRFRQIEGDIAERNAPRPDVTPGAFAPPAPITSEPIPPIRRAEESEPTPAQRTYMAHAEFDPSGSGRAIPVRPSDEDFLRYFTGRLLPSFRAPVRGGYRVFAPPDPMTVAPALESDQLKAYGLGRVIRGEER